MKERRRAGRMRVVGIGKIVAGMGVIKFYLSVKNTATNKNYTRRFVGSVRCV